VDHRVAGRLTRKQLLGYISGFVSGEGCFGLSRDRPRFSIHLRQDDRPLLELLAGATGLGRVQRAPVRPPLNPSATALEAAGLGDRRARAPHRPGGEARRASLRQQQRARIVDAVRRFEREHGRWPRALEFFRWRLVAAVDTPTQATVYIEFPGGWNEVLAQAR
jgi:hypothetical protein